MVSHLSGGGLTWPDYAVLFLSLGALVAIGLLFSGDQLGRSLLDLAQDGDCAIGPWGGRCLSLGDYVTVMGPTDGATASPEGVHVDYAQRSGGARVVGVNVD